ncbi:hypothetical protein DPEC_G00298510 [Dallia pectoralis]|uniref:Uncharacterized protein n=1 Tax=Dallia pectoralis TaxID=75939 RepID=A0ACC2FFR8_DALPE|nr:hypothetical protein DPEC_G00298510 [Dallia pectoralis]
MADGEEEKIRVCQQCEKEVAASNFALHESHCQRFLCLCPDCKEPVPRELLEQHRQDEHSQVKCTKCNKKMERCQLLDHQADECEARPQCCEFCELELPMSDMVEHSAVCGSRTERCSDCGRYVTLRDRQGHAQICPDLYSPEKESPPSADSEANVLSSAARQKDDLSFLMEKMKKHQAQQYSTRGHRSKTTEQPNPGLSRSTKSWRQEERNGNLDQIDTCPHCHLALPVFTLRWHEAKCQIHVSLK